MDSKWIKRGLLFAGIFILIIFLFSLNLPEIIAAFQQIPLAKLLLMLLLALAILIFNLLLKAYRWKWLVYTIAGEKISLSFGLASLLAGIAASSFIPGRMEVAKPLLLKTEYQIPLAKSLSALVVERFLDLLTLLLIPALALLFSPPPQNLASWQLPSLIFFLLLLATLTILYPRFFLLPLEKIITLIPLPLALKEKILSFLNQIILSFGIFKSHRQVISLGGISLLANSLEILRFYTLLHLLGLNTAFAVTAFIFTSSLVMGVLSAIPGGLGITEISAATLFRYADPASSEAISKSAILIDRIISYYLLIAVGALLLIFQKKFLTAVKTPKTPLNHNSFKSENTENSHEKDEKAKTIYNRPLL